MGKQELKTAQDQPKVEVAPESVSAPAPEPAPAPSFRVLELHEGAYSYDGQPGKGILGSVQKIYSDRLGGSKGLSITERAFVSSIVTSFLLALGGKREESGHVARILVPIEEVKA